MNCHLEDMREIDTFFKVLFKNIYLLAVSGLSCNNWHLSLQLMVLVALPQVGS